MSEIREFQRKLRYSQVEMIESAQAHTVPPWATGQALAHQVILFVVKGEGDLHVDEQIEPLEREAIFLFLPGTQVRIQPEANKPMLIFWIVFDRYVLFHKAKERLEYVREDSFPIQGRLRTAGVNSIRIMGLLMSSSEIGMGERRHFYGQQLLFELLHEMLDHASSANNKDSTRRLQATIAYMLRHYQENIQMSELAELGQFHPAYYSQIFKRLMEKTPMTFLTDLRMNKAKELLLTTGKEVSDVAAHVGFNDAFYFSRRFKEKNGFSPSVYVQKRGIRTISLSSPYTDQLFTLGHVPLAAQVYRSFPSQTQELHLPEHGADPWNASREVFIEAKPDLIICKDNVLEKAREHINDIAPIISIPWVSRDIYQHMQSISELVDRRQMAELWLEDFEKRAESWRGKLRRRIGGATVAICVCRDRALRMYGARNIGHVFYRTLNVSAPDRIAKQIQRYPAGTGFTWVAISPDDIEHYEADVMLVAVENDRDKQKVLHWTRTNASWARHPAVRAKRLVFIDWNKWMMYSPSGLRYQLDEAGYLLMGQGSRANLK